MTSKKEWSGTTLSVSSTSVPATGGTVTGNLTSTSISYGISSSDPKTGKINDLGYKYHQEAKIRLSYSKMSLYLNCPLAYKKLYIDKIPPKPKA